VRFLAQLSVETVRPKNYAGAFNICVFDPDYVAPSFHPTHMSRDAGPTHIGKAFICVSIEFMASAPRNVDPLHGGTTSRIPGVR
jgi:hypothetical protein